MHEHNNGISRRDLFKFGGIAAAGVVGAGALASCAPQGTGSAGSASTTSTTDETTTAAGHLRTGMPSFLTAPEAITDVKETKDYDVVVIGAGASGVPAALSAFEAGAKVALLQKESQAIAQGNSGSGIDLATSNPADIANLVSQLIADSQHRPNRELVELWAQNSGEAVKWVIEKSLEGGAQVIDQGNQQHMPLINKKGYDINFVTSFFGPKPYNTGDGMRALAATAEKEGVEIFYSTPAEQLVTGDGGKVTGVIAKGKDGHVQFNASKGVIVACGDYQNDEEMLHYYQPDMTNFEPKQTNKTGDGHKMVVWAAGKDEDFGKPANYLVPVDTPPFYGIHRHVRMSAICSGVDVNAKHECLTPEGEVIENLYAIGNCSGHFYGGIDYPLTVFGLSLGRCYTEGYVIGRMVAEK